MTYDIEAWRTLLLEHGYRQFPVRDNALHRASFAFQKRLRDEWGTRYFITTWIYEPLRDEWGTRYFITTWIYEPLRFGNGNEMPGSVFVELRINEPFFVFEQHGITDLSPETIEIWENRCRLFFETMGCRYYESDCYEGDPETPRRREAFTQAQTLDWARQHLQAPLLD